MHSFCSNRQPRYNIKTKNKTIRKQRLLLRHMEDHLYKLHQQPQYNITQFIKSVAGLQSWLRVLRETDLII